MSEQVPRSMTKYEMTEKLAEKMNVSLKEAEAALEFCDWDMLDAALQLERERGGQREAYSTERTARPAEGDKKKNKRWKTLLQKAGKVLRRLIACGNRNRFEVRRKGEVVLDVPVTVLVVGLLLAFWFCVFLLVVGLFTGCRYAFHGPELGKDFVNHAMDRAAETAEKVKEEVSQT